MASAHRARHGRGAVREGLAVKNGEAFDYEEIITFMEAAPANIFFKDAQGRYQFISEVCSLVNGGEEHSILGKTDLDIWNGAEIGRIYYEDDKRIVATGEGSERVDEFPAGAESVFYRIKKNPVVRGGKVVGIVGVIVDVTQEKRLERRLANLSFHDTLTGLYNRNYMELNCAGIMGQSKGPVSIIMADCNYLKATNDTLGHEYGDMLLCRIANAIESSVPDGGVVVRAGGDEFLALCPSCDADRASRVVQDIRRAFEKGSDSVIKLDAALGMCTVAPGEMTFEQAYHAADQDMYRNKQASRR